MSEKVTSDISVLWLIFTLVVLTGLSYITLIGLHSDSLQIFGSAVIFLFLLISSLYILSSGLVRGVSIPMGRTINQSAFFFMAGFFGWLALAKSSATFASTFTKSMVLEIVDHQLPPFWNWFMTAVVAPFVEEAWFLLAMPALLLIIFDRLNKELNLNLSKGTILILTLLLVALTFANFHVGVKTFTLFAISAIAFRSLQLLLYWSNSGSSVLQIDFIPAFAIGVHMSNNIHATAGYTASLLLLLTHPLGLILLFMFVVMAYLALDKLLTALFIPESRRRLLTNGR